MKPRSNPLLPTRRIVARVQTARAEIARQREAAARLTREITAEIEARILGALPLHPRFA